MTRQNEIESLYQEAQSALKAKDYARASDLLRQILKVNVDYKDAAQLLARVIKLSRRRWYNDPRTWGALGALLLVGLGIYLFPILQDLYRQPAPAPIIPTGIFTQTIVPPATATATATLLPTPTSIPLTWKRISMGQEFPRDSVTAFATDKNDPDVIYASMQNAGVYKTIDGGLSWRPAHHGLANTQVESLLIDSQNPNILYAGTMDGIYKTEDGGENWFRIGDGTYLLMDYQDNSHLYARDENGIYETTDQGNNWVTVHPLKRECPSEIHAWFIHPLDGNTLFVGGWGNCGPGVYESNDKGRTWTSTAIEGDPNVCSLAIGLDEQGNYSYYIEAQSTAFDENTWFFDCTKTFTVDPNNPSTVYQGGGNGLTTTRGKGYPWEKIGLRTIGITAINIDHYHGVERIIVGGSLFSTNHDNGIFISTDGGDSWINYKNGFGSARAELKLNQLEKTGIYLATYYRSVYSNCTLYRSLDSGISWSEIYHTAEWCGPAFDSENNFYLKDGGWQKTWDGGNHWWWGEDSRNNRYGLPNPSQSLSVNPVIDELIYSVGEEIYYSEDTGKLWQLAAGSGNLWDARLYYMDEGQTVFAIGRYHQAYSIDSGKIWQSCGEDVTVSRSDSRLAMDEQGSRLFLATSGNGVLVSADNCGSWQPSNNGLTNLFVNTLAIDPNNLDIVYAGTDGGAYISYDAGATWGQVNDGLLGATVVYSIAVDKESNVYAATPYGVFKLEGK
jgi:photosystem II stability/assembly factor-like uncharacterized protein